MSRLTDKGREPQQQLTAVAAPAATTAMPPLPAVNWESINNTAPVVLPFNYTGADAPLPAADIVVITWTTAEWSAFDHVFCNSDKERTAGDTSWQSNWKQYSKGAPPPPSTGTNFHLWGYYCMVQVTGQSGKPLTLLLFKAQTHLAYDPYLAGLTEMTNHILQDTGAAYLYSIGTAGGVGDADLLGNTVITNSGHLYMTNPNNNQSPLNNQTFSCTKWFPSLALSGVVQTNLLYPLSNVANQAMYNSMFVQLQAYIKKNDPTINMQGIAVSDLVNAPLNPANLTQPQISNCKDIPLLTTDFYYIAQPGDADKYCILEMDDAVLGQAAGAMGVNYAFVRNVSDPVVPDKTASGAPIPAAVQQEWSSLVYENFGFYTSYNGALATWATIAAM